MNDHDVNLRLELELDLPSGTVEALALRVLEVVEHHGSHIALGPVVGGTTSPPAIEVEFDVRAASSAEVHRRVAELIGLIERHAGVGRIRSASVAEREPVGS